ncbi:DUF3305 domain-containing protein [Mesorhizobium muleiense]|uniref:DUF3305 domain-containing protein n=1 Tax=Mesorhizobium muleiense TaxID=1004279 RepID=UPI001F430BD4|nr:DUF3305 domain-containing protein [Mesorhizobium muleiense]MCF6119356.1 DUF3305 domain-containing protein [Mesorhizobium muleiense]
MVRETAEVGVIVERRALDNPWIDHVWVPVAVLAGAPSAAPWSVLHESDGLTRFYAGTFKLELFGCDTGMYRDNLRSGRPSLWIALRSSDSPPGVVLHLVTADPFEGESLTEAGPDIIEAVPMPIELQQWLAAFVETHHVERPFIKRKRDRADPNALARRGPRSGTMDDAE